MSKLHELLAVEASLRNQSEACRKDLLNTFDKKKSHFFELLTTFKPLDENLPEVIEHALGLQTTVTKEIDWLSAKIIKAVDVAFQIDEANMTAREDIRLDNGTILAKAVPVTSLLQLEKRLKEVQDFVAAIPTLDPAKGFEKDSQRGSENGVIYKARDDNKNRTQKVTGWIVVAPATDKHPANVQQETKDNITGTVLKQEWSSLITVAEKGDMIDRTEELIRAVKSARSRANEQKVDVEKFKIGAALLNYAFSGKA